MIPLFKTHTPQTIDKPLLETLHSGYITQGPKVDEFEGRLADFFGTPNVVALNSGTSALTLAMRLAGIGPGDEVITTAMTCTATNLPVLSLGASIVFADCDPITGNINTESIEKLVTKKTKAILFVDWGGMPADLDQIVEIARLHNLKVIEDAAHAFGAEYKGQKVGTIADFTCFSLQAIKHITTGDGGILTCKDPADYERAKVLRWFGIDRSKNGLDSRIDQDIEEWGYKFHMNDLNATIGIVQMDHVANVLQAHRLNAKYYDENLDKYFVRQSEGSDRRSAWWLYTLLLPDPKSRDDFKKYMNDGGVMVNQVHKRNDEYTVFKPFARKGLDGLDYFADRMVCIPVHWGLSIEELGQIIGMCNEFAQKRGKKS
jgi:dTDP-4-amino-4,6-dideoxygalactose transaminase